MQPSVCTFDDRKWPKSPLAPTDFSMAMRRLLTFGSCKEAYSSLCYKHHTAMGTHVPYGITRVTCHSAEVTFPPLPQPIKASTRFSDPWGMQGWVDLVGLVTYQCGIPARRRSPIPVLTGLNVEQLRSYDEQCNHSAKPPTNIQKR